jgi:hypothetical protein
VTATSLLLSLGAFVLLAANVTFIGALYWVHVMRPAPMQRGTRQRHATPSYQATLAS